MTNYATSRINQNLHFANRAKVVLSDIDSTISPEPDTTRVETRAFAWFGGVFAPLRYDNLRTAVRKVLRGHRREETERFVVFRSHWGLQAEFCNPAEAHEKRGGRRWILPPQSLRAGAAGTRSGRSKSASAEQLR